MHVLAQNEVTLDPCKTHLERKDIVVVNQENIFHSMKYIKVMVTTWVYNLRKQNETYKRTPRHHKEALRLPNNGSPPFLFLQQCSLYSLILQMLTFFFFAYGLLLKKQPILFFSLIETLSFFSLFSLLAPFFPHRMASSPSFFCPFSLPTPSLLSFFLL